MPADQTAKAIRRREPGRARGVPVSKVAHGEELGSAFAPGVAAVIADMRATTFCDSSGARELLLTHHKATAGGIELRMVMPSAGVRRIFQLTGLDQVLAIYPTLAAGCADGHVKPAGRETEPADLRPVPLTCH